MLGDLIKEVSTPSTIKRLITKNYKEERVVQPLKETDYARASGVSYLCPREEVICALEGIERKSKNNAETMLTFAHGKALHWILQTEILPAIGILLGEWICLSCGKIYGKPEGTQPLSKSIVKKPIRCTNEMGCESEDFYYRELHFKDPEYQIGGHPDGFLSVPGMPGLGLFEAKSISEWSASFNRIDVAPIMAHVIQCQVYMWLTQLTWAKILYWEKGKSGVAAFTEHTVLKDDATIELIKKELSLIWTGIKTKVVPERTVCSSITCKRAEKCPVAAKCFGAYK